MLGPKTGRITDRLGAGRTILFSLFSLTIASLLYLVAMEITFVDGFIILAIARLIHGASGAAILTAGFAAASDIWPMKFGEISGKLIAMATIGGLLGPVIGGVAYTLGPEYAFIGLALITATIIPLVYVTTKELGMGGEPAQGSVPLKVFIQNPVLFRIGLLVTMTTSSNRCTRSRSSVILGRKSRFECSMDWRSIVGNGCRTGNGRMDLGRTS